MRKRFRATGAGLILALGALVGVTGCDTNYYGDSGATRTTTTTTAPAPVPPAAATTTTVTPNPDGTVTTTQQTYRHY